MQAILFFSLVAIYALTAAALLYSIKKKFSEKKANALLLFLLLLAILSSYTVFLVTATEITEIKYSFSENAMNSKKIVFVSDIHAGQKEDRQFVLEMVEKINSMNPDIVLLGGDFINQQKEAIENLEGLSGIGAKTFAVLGNHDYGKEWKEKEVSDAVEQKLEEIGITVLRNESASVEGLQIVGLDDLWSKNLDLEKAFVQDNNSPAILLSHNPDIFPQLKNRKMLVFSGHTHAGQFRLPLFGGVYTNSDFGYFGGFYNREDLTMYISRGIGEGIQARLFCSREIVEIEVRY